MNWRQLSDQKSVKQGLVRKRRSIRAIDQGTVYDIPGRLITVARDIHKATPARVTDATVILRREDGSVDSYHLGPGGRELQHWMASAITKKLGGE